MIMRWALMWRGTITRDVGTAYVDAETSEKAKADYERAHPHRRVTNIYPVADSSPPDTSTHQ